MVRPLLSAAVATDRCYRSGRLAVLSPWSPARSRVLVGQPLHEGNGRVWRPGGWGRISCAGGVTGQGASGRSYSALPVSNAREWGGHGSLSRFRETGHYGLDTLRCAGLLDLSEVVAQVHQLRLEPPGVSQHRGPVLIGQGRPGVMKQGWRTEAGTPRLQVEPAIWVEDIDLLPGRTGLDKPLTAVGNDPDDELAARIDVEP
jgi:hypothetical protein